METHVGYPAQASHTSTGHIYPYLSTFISTTNLSYQLAVFLAQECLGSESGVRQAVRTPCPHPELSINGITQEK